MALLLKTLFTSYTHTIYELSDVRSREWPFSNSPLPIVTVGLSYLYFVLKFGPWIMKDRKPFKIDTLMIFYNAIQILCSAYVVKELFPFVFIKYKWTCEPINFSNDPDALKVLNTLWVYAMIKIVDLLDTVFFVIRKKNKQITFLHVYHHTGMIFLGYVGIKFLGGGTSIYVPFINSFVHVIMYFYYMLSAWDKSFQESIWWKKYITQLQLLQFFFLFVTFGQIIFRSECGYPKWCCILIAPQYMFISILFTDFYIKTYVLPKKKKHEKPQKKVENGFAERLENQKRHFVNVN